ncbi:MAG: hypothetical protein ACI4JX_01070, partial [Oscillospiraceae bacterium]
KGYKIKNKKEVMKMLKRVIFAVDINSEPVVITVDDENHFKVLVESPDCRLPSRYDYDDDEDENGDYIDGKDVYLKAVKEFTDSVEDDSSWEFDSEDYNDEREMKGEDRITFEEFMKDLEIVYETEIDL